MPVFEINSKKIYFAHIPKTGGSAIEGAFIELADTVSFLSPNIHSDAGGPLPCSPQHMQVGLINKLFHRDYFDFKFAVVRNPVDRVASEYRHRIRKFIDQGKPFPEFKPWLRACFREYQKNPYYLDNHFRPQYEFLNSGFTVFKYEQGLDGVLSAVLTKVGVSSESCSDLLRKKNVGAKVRFPIDSESKSLICDVYAKDFEIFGYKVQ